MMLRGVTPIAKELRNGFKIVEGRENRPGRPRGHHQPLDGRPL